MLPGGWETLPKLNTRSLNRKLSDDGQRSGLDNHHDKKLKSPKYGSSWRAVNTGLTNSSMRAIGAVGVVVYLGSMPKPPPELKTLSDLPGSVKP